MRTEHGKDYEPEMPPLEGSEYILGYLYEIGPIMSGAMGSGPITHGELCAWQSNTGIRLSPWEVRTLRRLSIEYLNEQHRAGKLGCEPPWKSEDLKPEPSAVQQSLRALANL